MKAVAATIMFIVNGGFGGCGGGVGCPRINIYLPVMAEFITTKSLCIYIQ